MQKSYKEDDILPLYSILLYKNLAKVSSTFQHPRAKSRFQFFFFEKKSNPDAVGLIPQRTQKGTSMLFFVLCFIVCLCFWLTNVKGGSIQSTALFFLRNCTTKKKIAKSILQNTVETLFYASILLQYRFVSKLSLK